MKYSSCWRGRQLKINLVTLSGLTKKADLNINRKDAKTQIIDNSILNLGAYLAKTFSQPSEGVNGD